MAVLHLMHGFLGAGKTTLAKKLEQKHNALRLTPDEWMCRFYGNNPPADQFPLYNQRIKDALWVLAFRVLEMGQDVILDYGFWSRADRDQMRDFLERHKVSYRFHAVLADHAVMRARVLARTAELPDGALVIDEHAFDLFWSKFEPMGNDEVLEKMME